MTYLKSAREQDDKERVYLSTTSAWQAEKERLEKERDDVVYEMFQRKDKMMQDFRQLEKNNTDIWRVEDAMQSLYDSRINVCLNKRKANEARAKTRC